VTALAGILFAAWCALWWRIRGGAWETLLRLPPQTTVARLAAAAAMAAPLLAFTGWAPAFAAALWLGMAVAGWGHAMDIGRVAGTRWRDAVLMSGWGVVAAGPAALLMGALGVGPWALMAAGLLFGPIYALAWHLPRLPRAPGFAEGPTEWAECAVGAAIGAALWWSLA
jgi:hypothetical protein